MEIGIINGPNLNWLGRRQPDLYGTESMEELLRALRQAYPAHHFLYQQHNAEGALVEALQQLGQRCAGIVLNPAAYTHTSLAIADAVAMLPCPVLEVHLSNIAARGPIRQHSYVSAVARGSISGLGLGGYRVAVQHLLASGQM